MKGILCRNCGFEIKDTETAAFGPNGIAHHHYKQCLSAMRDHIASLESRLLESEARESVLVETLQHIADSGLDGKHYQSHSSLVSLADLELKSLPSRAAKVQRVLDAARAFYDNSSDMGHRNMRPIWKYGAAIFEAVRELDEED